MKFNREIIKSFNQNAASYEKAAKVQNEIGLRLFERLSYLKIEPKYILDLGCGTGVFTAMLKKKYPSAQIIAVDLAFAMLQQAKNKQKWRRKWSLINCNMTALPFASGLFDLVFANQVIHWSESLTSVFHELNRVMNRNGCLMFSTLGPDTFGELKSAWSQVDNFQHTNQFADMHDIGDSLMAEHWLDPVVDMELLTVHYPGLPELLTSLKAQGVRNINPARNRGLTGKASHKAFASAYQQFHTDEGKCPLTYEVIYGHAWKGEQRRLGQGTETFIPISSIIR